MAVHINENQREQKSVHNTKREVQGGGEGECRDPVVLDACTRSVRVVYTHWDTLYPPQQPTKFFPRVSIVTLCQRTGVPGRNDLCHQGVHLPLGGFLLDAGTTTMYLMTTPSYARARLT